MQSHEKYIKRCFELAQTALGNTSPNPLVGSVIVYKDKIIGEGYHQQYGEAHAEVNAINSVKNKSQLKEATIYVSLEPCNHFGKTPPCSHLIVKHQIPKVVIANIDPFAKVNGSGIQYLKENGIEVISGVLEDEGAFINRRFFTFHQKKRPYIILKWAQTADGFMDIDRSINSNDNYWITTAASKRLVHQWRSEEDAILVGFNTVKNDNPSLTTREVKGKNPIRIILDRNMDLSKIKSTATFNIFNDEAKTIIINEKESKTNKNINFIQIDFENELKNLVQILHDKNIQSIIIEGGKKTLEKFITTDLWDEARVFTAEKKFNKGLKAPTIFQKYSLTQKVDSDILSFYFNS